MRRSIWTVSIVTMTLIALTTGVANAAGMLTPKGAVEQPIQIRDHVVNVTINNGFAMTEVVQTFYNPNAKDLEAVYSFPLPKSASLSEVTIFSGETRLDGEVLPKAKARQAYEEERDQGNDAGLTEKNDFYSFEFYVSPVRAQQETRIRFLYYQPLEIELGVGRYLYPLQEGGTDDAGASFWTVNDKVEGFFSVNLDFRSAVPVEKVRVPGFDQEAVIENRSEGRYTVLLQRQSANLNRDFIFYYKLAENLPGRVDVYAYKPGTDKTGTFMMVVTPGMDLKPLNRGADYVFVLDVSGSMAAKLGTLARGVTKSMGEMSDQDRFRIVTFNDSAKEITSGWITATAENVRKYADRVENLSSSGSTNVYDGLSKALATLDNDRATSVVLVTDGVTNTGVLDPKDFYDLLKKNDVRVFGFVMGNSANWPLMRIICEETGGFAAGVSNDDDIIGQIMLAKGKMLYECLHHAELKVSGVKVRDANDGYIGKLYRGQQLVIFGRYDKGGRANVTLKGALTGQDKVYQTEFDFPDTATDLPEMERLWALNQIEHIRHLSKIGLTASGEAEQAVEDIGVQYQLVTDETSMVVLADDAFSQRGIERRNQTRVRIEEQARSQRGSEIVNHRVDSNQPMFNAPAPSVGGGGGGSGALDPITVMLMCGGATLIGIGLRKARQHEERRR